MMTQTESDKLKQAFADTRAASRTSLREFAAALGVSHQAVGEWESGVSSPTYERIIEWLRDERPWVHQLGAAIANIKYAELLAHTTAVVVPAPEA